MQECWHHHLSATRWSVLRGNVPLSLSPAIVRRASPKAIRAEELALPLMGSVVGPEPHLSSTRGPQ